MKGLLSGVWAELGKPEEGSGAPRDQQQWGATATWRPEEGRLPKSSES